MRESRDHFDVACRKAQVVQAEILVALAQAGLDLGPGHVVNSQDLLTAGTRSPGQADSARYAYAALPLPARRSAIHEEEAAQQGSKAAALLDGPVERLPERKPALDAVGFSGDGGSGAGARACMACAALAAGLPSCRSGR